MEQRLLLQQMPEEKNLFLVSVASCKANFIILKPFVCHRLLPLPLGGGRSLVDVDFSLFRPLEFFVDPKNGDGRNNNPPAMRVRVDCYTKKLPFRVQ